MNTELWDKLCTPPKEALKEIKGGRLSGMTDINPTWRIRRLTEVFGPCGFGWKYMIEEVSFREGSDGEVAVYVEIYLYVKHNNEWSEPIPGMGGSKFITKESKGFHTSDEAVKMAVTDALSTAAKMIGLGADIYMGLWDGSKYKNSGNLKEEKKDVALVDAEDKCRTLLDELKFPMDSFERVLHTFLKCRGENKPTEKVYSDLHAWMVYVLATRNKAEAFTDEVMGVFRENYKSYYEDWVAINNKK